MAVVVFSSVVSSVTPSEVSVSGTSVFISSSITKVSSAGLSTSVSVPSVYSSVRISS